MRKTLPLIIILLISLNVKATIYTFDVTPTITKEAPDYSAGDVFLNNSEICLNVTTTGEDVWFPIFANPSSDGLSYSYKDNETNLKAGKKAIVYKASEQAFVFDGTKRKMKISGLKVGDRIYMSIGSKGSSAHTFTVTGATADSNNPVLSAKGDTYVYVDWYFTANATEVIFEVAAGGSIIKTIKTGSDATSSVNQIFISKGIYFNGTEIVNNNNSSLLVYNILGKQVASANRNISVDSFQQGVYFVKAEGVNGILKFKK